MKTMKGRILNKLKSIPQMQLKQSRILQLKASSDGFFFNSPPPLSSHLLDCRDHPQIMDEVELMRDFDDDEDEDEDVDKENINLHQQQQGARFHGESRTMMNTITNSPTLFDPNLLTCSKDYFRIYELLEQMKEKEKKEEVNPPLNIPKISDLLKEFNEKWPPNCDFLLDIAAPLQCHQIPIGELQSVVL